MFENWDKYDQEGIGWTCRLQSFRAAPAHGMGLLAPARGTGLRTPARSASLQARSPPRSLRRLWRSRRNDKQTQTSIT